MPVRTNVEPATPFVAGLLSRPLTESDIEAITRMVMAEAACEPYTGQQCVAAVILNRLMPGNSYPDTVQGVLNQRAGGYWHFEPMGVPGRMDEIRRIPRTDERYIQARSAVQSIIDRGDSPCPVQGRTIFMNVPLVQQRNGGYLPYFLEYNPSLQQTGITPVCTLTAPPRRTQHTFYGGNGTSPVYQEALAILNAGTNPREVQRMLSLVAGYNGGPDGNFGSGTRAAIRQFEGDGSDGYLNADSLARLRQAADSRSYSPTVDTTTTERTDPARREQAPAARARQTPVVRQEPVTSPAPQAAPSVTTAAAPSVSSAQAFVNVARPYFIALLNGYRNNPDPHEGALRQAFVDAIPGTREDNAAVRRLNEFAELANDNPTQANLQMRAGLADVAGRYAAPKIWGFLPDLHGAMASAIRNSQVKVADLPANYLTAPIDSTQTSPTQSSSQPNGWDRFWSSVGSFIAGSGNEDGETDHAPVPPRPAQTLSGREGRVQPRTSPAPAPARPTTPQVPASSAAIDSLTVEQQRVVGAIRRREDAYRAAHNNETDADVSWHITRDDDVVKGIQRAFGLRETGVFNTATAQAWERTMREGVASVSADQLESFFQNQNRAVQAQRAMEATRRGRDAD
ncbi:MAG: peptidoglycan-binding protein [Rickettsiales bacterium]